jgi:predicted O-methyltransferase YrrM
MYSPFIAAIKFIKYYLKASNGKGHGAHSPFVFDFITNVLNDDRAFYAFKNIEKVRTKLLQNNTVLQVDDFGAGSKIGLTKERTIKEIASSSLKPKKYAQLLFKIVNYYQPQTILELGTSLGVTTAYLASANANALVTTMEGSSQVSNIATTNFTILELKNITQIQGNFDNTLPETVSKLTKIDLAFLDGNHRYQPTLNYFQTILPKVTNESIIILDDIHWSKEMEQAWNEIKNHPSVTLSIDLFFIGMVFFKQEFKGKQHFTIRF